MKTNRRKIELFVRPVTKKEKNSKINNQRRIMLTLTKIFGPSFTGKTYLMLKLLSRISPDRDIYIITKAPPEQFPSSKIKIKEISDEIKPLNE